MESFASFFDSESSSRNRWSYDSLKNFRQISPVVQTHLKQVIIWFPTSYFLFLDIKIEDKFASGVWILGSFLIIQSRLFSWRFEGFFFLIIICKYSTKNLYGRNRLSGFLWDSWLGSKLVKFAGLSDFMLCTGCIGRWGVPPYSVEHWWSINNFCMLWMHDLATFHISLWRGILVFSLLM